jgi:hypothetical protein
MALYKCMPVARNVTRFLSLPPAVTASISITQQKVLLECRIPEFTSPKL